MREGSEGAMTMRPGQLGRAANKSPAMASTAPPATTKGRSPERVATALATITPTTLALAPVLIPATMAAKAKTMPRNRRTTSSSAGSSRHSREATATSHA